MNTKTYFSKISNAIFLIFSILILSFIWLNYYLRNFKISLISSILITSVLSIGYFIFQTIKTKSSKSKLLNSKIKENIASSLIYSTHKDNIDLICELFDIVCLKVIDNHHIISQNADIFIFFEKEQLEQENLVAFLKNRQTNTLQIFCINSCNPNLDLKGIKIEIFTIDDITPKAVTQNNAILHYECFEKKPKLKLKNYLCIILNKDRSKGYFSFGILLLVSSLFTIYHTYYIVMGTILLLLSIYSKFNSRFNI